MPPAAVEDEAIQMNDEMLENGAPEPQESNPVESVKGKVQTLLENTPTDFGAWTLLLSEVENTSPNDIQRICLVYDAFLSEFPLCYGYWKKYASHKARLCTLYEVEELYERAVQTASYSIDLWVSYCSFAMLSYEDPADIRRVYERALSFVGNDYLCHLLWDKYIEFEYSQKQWSRLAHIYINTLRFPIKKLHSYYASFKKLVATLEEDIECRKDTEVSSEFVSNCGTEKVKDCGYTEISNVIRDLLGQQDGLPRPNAVKKYLTIGKLFYQRSNELDTKVSYFEARIRRPYFHVKPLDDCQLENWHQYLDFVEMQGNFDWTVKLYERCLIPCANYSEFWIRYVEFVDARGGREIAKYALDRALTIFLKRVPAFHAYCAMFKEQIGDVCGARTLFLQSVTDSAPEFIENVNREANMEKRMGNIDAACMIYKKAIEMAKEKHVLQILPVLYTNFAQFTFVARGSIDAAREVFVKGIQQMPSRSILERLIRFITMHGGAGQIPNLDSIVVNAIAPESNVSKALSSQDREDISKLFLEFVELYGTIHDIRKAWDRHRKLFPHIMRPSFNFTVPEKNTLDKSKEGRDQVLVSPSHHICGDKSHGGSEKHLMNDPQLKNSAGILCEGVIIHKLPLEEDNTGTKEIEEQVVLAEVKEQSIPEGIELDVEINELTHECPDVAENPGVSPEPSEIGNPVKAPPDHESSDDLRPPALDSLSINSPDTRTQQQSNPITLNEHGVCQNITSVLDGNRIPDEHNVHQEPTSILDGDKEQDGGNANKVSEVHEPSLQDMKSTPSQANLQNVDSPLHPASDLDPSEAEINSKLQMQAQSQTSSHQGSPASGECPQNSNSAGNGTQMYYGRHASEDSSTSSHGYVQASHSQQWQGLEYPPAATKSQTLIIPGYSFPPQAWSNAQDQQANQTQGQYQMAATQAYSTGNLAWPGQNIQQQGFVYSQPQLSTHATSQSQSEVYQPSVQTNEHIRHSQGYQGFAPHIWQYHQQHLYYLQQQQLQQKNSQQQQQQQQHPENQVLLQIQQQSQNQQEPQQHLSTEKNQSLELQQQHQTSQFQQQNPQMHHTQQQQEQLLYMQQQQHLYLQQQQQQLYLQQQLLQQQLLQQQQQQYQQQAQQIIAQQQQQAQQLQQQQQQQPQLLQQEQQPQLLQQQQQQQPDVLQQQQQQELLQQQQNQQLLLLQQQQLYQLQLQQQQQQRRQQISASELQALNISYYLQTLPVQYGNYQQRQDLGQEAETSQGEGANLQTAEHSGSYPSTPQQGATKQ